MLQCRVLARIRYVISGSVTKADVTRNDLTWG